MNQIQLATFSMSRETLWHKAEGQFEYNPKGKWPAVQRACFWMLRKLKAFASIGATEIRRTTLDLDKLVDALMRNRYDVECIYNKRAKYLIIGYDQWLTLTSDTSAMFQMFEVPYTFNARVGYDCDPMPKMFAGLKVVVVPWVDGMFVLPELN